MDTKITLLRGPDRVRKRPAVLFGSDDIEGVQSAVLAFLNIYATESLLGHCTQLSVIQDGSLVELRGNDRGIYLGQNTQDDTIWKNLFCELYAASAYPPDESGYRLGLFDSAHHILYGEKVDSASVYYPESLGYMELCALQFASEVFDVEVVRNGCRSTLHFEKGFNIGGICHKPTEDPSGTRFCFRPDKEVFQEVVIPAEFFRKTLQSLSMLCPALTCRYQNLQTGADEVFSYPKGISDYASALSDFPVFYGTLEAKGKDRYNRAEYTARVEVAIAFTPDEGSTLCLHNFQELPNGGHHLEQLQEQLSEDLESFFSDPDVLQKHFTIVLATFCSPHKSDWCNGARNAIRNKMIVDMTCDIIYPHFQNYLHEYRNAFSQVAFWLD